MKGNHAGPSSSLHRIGAFEGVGFARDPYTGVLNL